MQVARAVLRAICYFRYSIVRVKHIMQGKTGCPVYLSPLVIGVTGHRDLVANEIDGIRLRIAALIDELQRQFPNTPIRMMTALAEGADRIAATAALDSGLEVQAILPMPAEEYLKDFDSAESKAEFNSLCERCEVLTLPIAGEPSNNDEIRGADRDLCYANAGMFISAHCHILLAIWDGRHSESLGGTSQIVYFQHFDRLPGIAESVPRTSLFLTDDESDLVYHISCSRLREPDEPKVLEPLQYSWFTTDPDVPRDRSMPRRYVDVFNRADEFNADVQRFLKKQDELTSSEASPPDTRMREPSMRVRNTFDIADVLANHFQKRVDVTLAAIYTLAFLAGLTFMLYSEVSDLQPLIYAFLASLLLGLVLATLAKKRQWHRKYLDYRVLAEGLRVQYYRSIAGIHGEGHTKFAYDNFLRQRDMELGWIRNVMRAAGILTDAQPADESDDGLRFAIDNWIGSKERPGQLEYYRSKSLQRMKMNRLTDIVTLACLWGGIVVACLLAFFLTDIGNDKRDSLIILMGVLPLIAGIAEVYTQRKADRELTKQYQFMENVFSNARRRLKEATNNTERREVLQGLGDAALSEHAEWILVHRERQPEPAGL